MKLRQIITSLILACPAVCLGKFSTLTSADGVEVEGRILSRGEENVTFERIDGNVFTVPVSRLSKGSQDIIENWEPLEFTHTFENSWGEDANADKSFGKSKNLDEYKLKIRCSSGEEMKLTAKELDVFPAFFAAVQDKIQQLEEEDVPEGFSFVVPMPGKSEGLKWKIDLQGNNWRLYMPKYFNQTAGMSIFEVFEPSSNYLKESTYLYWKDFLEDFDFDQELKRDIELRKKVE